jgi:DNA-binding NarL/FixJ family response regulator
MSIRVAIVEDDPTVRENLADLVGGTAGFNCVGSCATAEAAWQQLPPLAPDVVLMDIHLPGRNGIACVERLRKLLPDVQVIMLTIEEDSERVFESLKAGATGYLVKHATPAEILEAIAAVHRGGAPMSASVARKVVTAFRQPAPDGEWQLSEREVEVLRLLARGHRSKEIASELGIGVGTVNTYVRHIYEKLHVRSRAEAVAKLKKV